MRGRHVLVFEVWHELPNRVPPSIPPTHGVTPAKAGVHLDIASQPQGRPVGTEDNSHTSRQRRYPKMDPGLRQGDTELGMLQRQAQKTYPHPLHHPPQSTPSPRSCAVATNGRCGDNRGAWVARLCVDAKDQPDAGVCRIGTKTCPQARIPDRPTRKGGCLRRAQKIPVQWRASQAVRPLPDKSLQWSDLRQEGHESYARMAVSPY